jgi:predicted NBD/HSP70 family sugar kinase
LRDSNLRLVLATVLAAEEPPSRAAVAATTGLTRSTVSRLADELVTGGLLDELDRSPAPGRGRPGTPLVAGSGVAALGMQVNPGFLAARVVDLRGRVLAEDLVPGDLSGSDPVEVLRRLGLMARTVERAAPASTRLVGRGLAVPGLVAARHGRLLSAPNLGWADVPIRRLLPRGLGGSALTVANEAELAARTVAAAAPGRPGPYPDFFYVSGEVGVGGAIVLDGRVFGGRYGWAGEVGHITVDTDGLPCSCGSRGCLEQYAGLRALRQDVERAGWALGVALAAVVNLLDIPTIVLGGHLAHAADALRPGVLREMEQRVLSSPWRPPDVRVADEDPAAGATGAAYQVFDQVLDAPASLVPQR